MAEGTGSPDLNGSINTNPPTTEDMAQTKARLEQIANQPPPTTQAVRKESKGPNPVKRIALAAAVAIGGIFGVAKGPEIADAVMSNTPVGAAVSSPDPSIEMGKQAGADNQKYLASQQTPTREPSPTAEPTATRTPAPTNTPGGPTETPTAIIPPKP